MEVDDDVDTMSSIQSDEDDLPILPCNGRRAVSSGEPSLDGSIDIDEDRGALSDSDIAHVARSSTIAAQVKGPSSDALEESCRRENEKRLEENDDSWEDILGSGQLLKKVLTPGLGSHVIEDQQWVKIRVVDTLYDVDSHQEISFVTGFSMVTDAWELVVKLMHTGEKVAIKTSALLAYGEVGSPGKVPPNQDQKYTIEVLEVSDKLDFPKMSDDEMVSFIQLVKDRGNYYFKRTEYDKAIFVYKRILSVAGEPTDDRLRELFSVLNFNLALCYHKCGEQNETIQFTEKSIEHNPNNVKALFHRAVIYSERGDYDEASSYLDRISSIIPEDSSELLAVQLERQRLNERRLAHKQKERKMYRKMVQGAGDMEMRQNWMSRRNLLIVAAIIILIAAIFIQFFYL